MKEYVKRSWEDVEKYIDTIINSIQAKGVELTGVYGIPRGGIIPATIIAYRLDIPLLSAPVENCLIIDDRSDSGSVFAHFLPNPHQSYKYYMALLETSNPDIYRMMDFVGKLLESDYMTIFAWETVTPATHPWLFEEE